MKHISFWQLKNLGRIEGDCDDMATYVAYILKRMGYLGKIVIPTLPGIAQERMLDWKGANTHGKTDSNI